jgi:hypothetical protein
MRSITVGENLWCRSDLYLWKICEAKVGNHESCLPIRHIMASFAHPAIQTGVSKAHGDKHKLRGLIIMKRDTSGVFALAVAAGCLCLSAFAADLSKSGKYSGHYGWAFTGQVQKLGEDRVVYAGTLPGVMFNNEGKGFMHKARVDCTLFNDVNKGRANANGTCVVTDADGDKVFVEWRCAGVMPACPGTERFVGGTGKYTGISGDQKFQGNFIGDTGAGWSDWSGEYKLP